MHNKVTYFMIQADNWSKKLQQMKKRWDMIQRSIPNSQQVREKKKVGGRQKQ